MKETSLFSPSTVKLLESKYGFVYVDDEESSYVFKKLIEKKK